jgi:hypothetical protein
MSQEPGMTNREKNASDNQGFRTALYFNFQQYDNNENRLKEVTEALDSMKVSSDNYATPTITPRQSDTYKNFISSDLLKRLEDGSPIPQKYVDLKRKPSEIYLYNCDKDEMEGEMLSSNINQASGIKLIHQTENNQIEEESKELDKSEDNSKSNSDINENVITSMTNLTTRNYKLKTSVMNKKTDIQTNEIKEKYYAEKINEKNNFIPEKEKPQSLFTDTINFGNMNTPNNNYFSPQYDSKTEKTSRKDSSPILSYYDGTTEYISQNFLDEFKKINNNEKIMSKTNFIKKVEPVQEEYISSHSNFDSGNTSNSFFYNSSRMTDDQSSFNSFQVPMNYFNNGGLNSNFLNVNNLSQNFDMRNRMTQRNRQINNNFMDFSNNSEGLGMMNINTNMNKINPSLITNGHFINQAPLKRTNIRVGTTPSQPSQLHGQIEALDDYSVEMFGRKGWICEMCNNFNYESKFEFFYSLARQKCNRCGINKTPKKIKRQGQPNKINTDSKLNHSLNDVPDELNDSSDKKKKKPFVERVGDWVCIKCKNLNFSFRVVCNRCQIPKTESDKMFEHYMSNLMNYVKVNEIMQQKIILNQSQNSVQNIPNYTYNNNVNSNNFNMNSNYYNFNPNNVKTNSNMGAMRNPYNSNSNINGAIYNTGSSMSMGNNSSSQINGSSIGGQFHISNVEENEYYEI